MALWAVYNGWMGNGSVAVLVEADQPEGPDGARAKAMQAMSDEYEARRQPPSTKRFDYCKVTTMEKLQLPAIA